MDEMLPWGLNVAQTSILCFGVIGILGIWIVLKNIFKIATTALLMIVALLLAVLFCALVGFYLVNSA
jgi:hypothetical protein